MIHNLLENLRALAEREADERRAEHIDFRINQDGSGCVMGQNRLIFYFDDLEQLLVKLARVEAVRQESGF